MAADSTQHFGTLEIEQGAGDLWVLHSAGTQINMLSCCTHAPNMMKEKHRGNQFISTLNMGQGPGQRHRV